MSFLQKHEFMFGGLIGVLFILPLMLQYLGYIHVVNVDKDVLVLPLLTVLAVIPVLIWTRIFNKEHHEGKATIFFAFLAGCSSTLPVFFYQKLFISGQEGNFIFFKATAVNFQTNIAELFGYNSLSHLTSSAVDGALLASMGILLVFMGVGVLEEVMKHVVVNKKAIFWLGLSALLIAVVRMIQIGELNHVLFMVGVIIAYFLFLRYLVHSMKINSIDDVIEVAIISALGFAFVENIYYFSGKIETISAAGFAFFVLVRVTIVTVVHVLCSAILGYHVGLAHFAKPVLQDEIAEGRKFYTLRFLHTLFGAKAEKIFYYEQVFLGIFLAVMVHAFYDFFMQLQFQVFGIIPFFALVMPFYFIGGLWYVFYLLEKKEDHKEYGKLNAVEA